MLGRIIVYPKTIPISLASIIQQPVPPLTLAERAALLPPPSHAIFFNQYPVLSLFRKNAELTLLFLEYNSQ
jgi:hypothetical protein